MHIRQAFLICLLYATALSAQDPLFSDISDLAGTGNGASNNGVVIGDFDNDGFEDIFIPSRTNDNRIFKNLGNGTFQDVTATTGIQTGGFTMTGVWGDIDNDGDLDLFVGNYHIPSNPVSNYLYRNNGNGTFTDISTSAGVKTNDQTRSVHMADINQDGYVDIYVCNLLQQNIYWRNNGNNTFTNLVYLAGLTDSQISMGAIFFDYDNDGDPDVYLTHDANQANIMYENDGDGTFTNVSGSTNLNVAGQGMGVDHGDINNDGHLDIYVSNLGANFLLLNDGNGTFTEIAEAAGVTDENGMGWGCFFIDYDNDGWEDIYVINDSQFNPASNKLYKNNGDNTFTIVSDLPSPLFSFHAGRGGIWADFNNDGFPEITVANNSDIIGVQIFENQNTLNNWIAFEVEGFTDARDAFGTRIQLSTINGIKIDEKTGGSSYASQSSHRIYFGLGQGEAADIIVTWPNGSVDSLGNLAINQIHAVQQSFILEDADNDGFFNNIDCDDNNENVNPNMYEIIYNGIDDDCNPLTFDDDFDQDGFNLADDCNDTNSNINPNASEIPYNGFDDDCNPLTFDDDLDQDGFNLAQDCEDNNPNINPDASEITYNGIDDDCNETTLDDDLDQDGFSLANDCDDNNPNINPDATEITYNGIDDDCNETTLDDDLDQDGFNFADDCDDENPDINPDATEIANNGIDEDCVDGDLMTSVHRIANHEINIYPNPISRFLYLEYDGPDVLEYRLYNNLGELLYTGLVSQERIFTGALNTGVYYLLIVKDGEVLIWEKILKI